MGREGKQKMRLRLIRWHPKGLDLVSHSQSLFCSLFSEAFPKPINMYQSRCVRLNFQEVQSLHFLPRNVLSDQRCQNNLCSGNQASILRSQCKDCTKILIHQLIKMQFLCVQAYQSIVLLVSLHFAAYSMIWLLIDFYDCYYDALQGATVTQHTIGSCLFGQFTKIQLTRFLNKFCIALKLNT